MWLNTMLGQRVPRPDYADSAQNPIAILVSEFSKNVVFLLGCIRRVAVYSVPAELALARRGVYGRGREAIRGTAGTRERRESARSKA